jgi:hypothetical protein
MNDTNEISFVCKPPINQYFIWVISGVCTTWRWTETFCKKFPVCLQKKPLAVIDEFSLIITTSWTDLMPYIIFGITLILGFDYGLVFEKKNISFRELDVFPPLGGKVWIGVTCTFDYRWKSYIQSLLSLKCTEEIENSFVYWTPESCFLPILRLRRETVNSVMLLYVLQNDTYYLLSVRIYTQNHLP